MTLDPRTIEACAKVAENLDPDALRCVNGHDRCGYGADENCPYCENRSPIAAAIRALASKRCDGCDGHDCDNGCAYPGALPYPSETQSSDSRDIAEAIIRDCIPGGQICDPQEIADNIRTWFKSSDVAASRDSSGALSQAEPELSEKDRKAVDWLRDKVRFSPPDAHAHTLLAIIDRLSRQPQPNKSNDTPVTYQWLHTDPISGNPVWRAQQFWNGHSSQESRPLYTHPALDRESVALPDREAIAVALERIIASRWNTNRIDGYTREMSYEQADAIRKLAQEERHAKAE